MIEYIVKDMIAVLRLVPLGMLLGIPLGIVYYFLRKKGKPGLGLASMLFGTYLGIILAITFFSRELGSAGETIDLKLFSTWHINTRNRAFFIENILLFIPYGFLYCAAFRKKWPVVGASLVGFVTSLGIETMQLVTKRGIFQLDDIITNAAGALVGALLYCFVRLFQKKPKA